MIHFQTTQITGQNAASRQSPETAGKADDKLRATMDWVLGTEVYSPAATLRPRPYKSWRRSLSPIWLYITLRVYRSI